MTESNSSFSKSYARGRNIIIPELIILPEKVPTSLRHILIVNPVLKLPINWTKYVI